MNFNTFETTKSSIDGCIFLLSGVRTHFALVKTCLYDTNVPKQSGFA